MEDPSSFVTLVQEALRPELCVICGKNHNRNNCDYIKIAEHVPDKPIPPKARLSLPDFLEVRLLTDGSYLTVTKAPISKGTQFGPFQAEKTNVLEISVAFPLKIFSSGKENEAYLNNNNEETCSWLMYVGTAEFVEEQNLICYQDKGEIYYVAIKDIDEGEFLKVWYSPYYAFKMNKPAILPNEDITKKIDVNALIKTQQKIMERKTWTCKFCSHIEASIADFARHILTHYSAQLRKMCEVCKKSFGSKKLFKNHRQVVHRMALSPPSPKPSKNADPGRCKDVALGGPLLNEMFTDSTDLQQSVLNQFDLNMDNQNLLLDGLVDNLLNDNVKDLDHFNFEIDDSQKQFICDICLKEFTKLKLLILHLRHHTGDFICPKCLKVFCRKENWKSHICNSTGHHRCNICDKTFTQNKYLARHVQAMHERKYHCVSCSKNFYCKKELLEHNCSKMRDTDKDKFSCPLCGKHFYRKLYLKRHLKVHGPRVVNSAKRINFTCETCGVQLETRNSYYLHKKKHENSNYSCEICDKKFYRKDTYKGHLLTHENVLFECGACDKKYKTQKLLNLHRRKGHGNDLPADTFDCTICDTTFKVKSSLNKHMRNRHAHRDAEPATFTAYSCPVCAKTIKLKSSLLRHLRKVHSNVKEVDLSDIGPRVVLDTSANEAKGKKRRKKKKKQNDEKPREDGNMERDLQDDVDDQINSLLTSAENNLAIRKDAVDSLVEELDIDRKKEQKENREVCLSIPDLTDNSYQEITLDKNAYILDNGTIVQPQGDSDNVVIYVLDQAYQ